MNLEGVCKAILAENGLADTLQINYVSGIL